MTFRRLLNLPRPLLFTTVAGALRISTKYEIEGLRSWSIYHLRIRWPSSLEFMDLNSLPYAAGTFETIVSYAVLT